MEGLYPPLHEKFRNESICPICLIEMTGTPKYSCANQHTICHRCKPYYYSCPTCRSPLNIEAQQYGNYQPPPAVHFMPHPYPLYPSGGPQPSAPFIEHEKLNWSPPVPTEDQHLYSCQYNDLGCQAKIPEHLRNVHESRCQFRSQSENFSSDEGPLENCRYHVVGCNVRLIEWRKVEHEKICIYKDRMQELGGLHENFESLNFGNNDEYDPEELVECIFREHGCMVKMPRRRQHLHQEKCNCRRNHNEYDEKVYYESEPELDPEEKLPCRWSEFGCQVQPRRCRKETHEEKCNYRRHNCKFAEFGCSEMVEFSRRYLHEQRCNYA